ncbi:aldo/keto reductase [Catenulispora sp. NF23]|uniref:aldo/keto reductase n=1 Tax=Catenulispora pinistramenti TaxID=2705254 RepID=UPI001BAB879F|nr:aldo/keto reductase [Catenulispora pinistramenti]MBS2533318.1 aldo/keto reductase [Catenulispora pinistramenti]
MRTADRRLILGLYRTGPQRDLLTAALEAGVTALDTAFSYQDFDAHQQLADAAGELLSRFDITTKIGFFRDGHDLSAARLRAAAERIRSDLGRAPDTMLLHNPERTPTWLTQACRTMIRMRDEGLCRAWGLSTWNPRPLLGRTIPEPPDVLMIRAGLMVPAEVLDAAEQLIDEVKPVELRGMAPLGGHSGEPVWTEVDPAALFLRPGQNANRVQAAVAAAFHLPAVTAVTAGTGNPHHLAELAQAPQLDVNLRAVEQYRTLIRARTSVATAHQGE